MRTFSQYTDSELLQLDNEAINTAIRLEAIDRGIQPPIPISEGLRKSEWRGYQLPAEHVEVFEICTKDGHYSNVGASGIAYLTEERAKAAIEGVVYLDRPYNKSPRIVPNTDVTLQKVFIGVSNGQSKAEKLEEFFQDNTEFDKVRDECLERLGKARQDDYNKRVNAEKKVEYLRLAGGDENIARGFWAKVERTDWPL